jgi:uncharacterized OB-fold protein
LTSGLVDELVVDAVAPRPVPVADSQSLGFWEAAAEHRLAIQRCTNCDWLSYPPDILCARCCSPQRSFRWETVSGRARLRSWTVVRTAFLPGFAPYVPYVVAAAELEEQDGLRVTARLVDGPYAALTYGAAVETVFEDMAGGVAVPMFRLVGP